MSKRTSGETRPAAVPTDRDVRSADLPLPRRSKVIPAHAGNLERLLGSSEFFVGDRCTVADLTVFDVLTNFSFNLCATGLSTRPSCPTAG